MTGDIYRKYIDHNIFLDVTHLENLTLNEVRRRVTTYPGTGQVVTRMVDLLDALNSLYHMQYNYTWAFWNIHRRLLRVQNIHFDTKSRNSAN